jgi:hypothetical protein|tara:strand:+ start:833 stop:955 length:123 start_codon:yes stop_codon:yes gene_type:complete
VLSHAEVIPKAADLIAETTPDRADVVPALPFCHVMSLVDL